jgi:hypothetical protein
MAMKIYKTVPFRAFRSELHNENDECTRLKKIYYDNMDSDNNFKKLMTITVKHKIVLDFMTIFNAIIRGKGRLEGENLLIALNLMKRITQRVKIQLNQMKKLGNLMNHPDAWKTNEIYYKKLIKAVYECILYI